MTNGVPSLAIRLNHGDAVASAPSIAREVAAVLTRPCFAELSRLSARRRDRWSKHVKPSAEQIAEYLIDSANDAISLDTKRGGELRASAQIENGVGRESAPVFATRLMTYVVIPFVATELTAVVAAVCDLAAALRAAAGFIALDARHGLAHEIVLGGSRPRERIGLGQQRFRERRGRWRHDDRIETELAGVEWGTFLGPGHVPKINLDEVHRSGAFARVVQVTPALAYLQVTENPMDDLTEEFEEKLVAARRALAPVLMDVSAISLE